MVGPALFALVAVALTMAQYDFMIEIGWRPVADPAGAWPSGLALGPYGWAQSLSFAISGLLLAVFAFGLHHGMAGSLKAGPAGGPGDSTLGRRRQMRGSRTPTG